MRLLTYFPKWRSNGISDLPLVALGQLGSGGGLDGVSRGQLSAQLVHQRCVTGTYRINDLDQRFVLLISQVQVTVV